MRNVKGENGRFRRPPVPLRAVQGQGKKGYFALVQEGGQAGRRFEGEPGVGNAIHSNHGRRASGAVRMILGVRLREGVLFLFRRIGLGLVMISTAAMARFW